MTDLTPYILAPDYMEKVVQWWMIFGLLCGVLWVLAFRFAAHLTHRFVDFVSDLPFWNRKPAPAPLEQQ